MTSEIRHTEVEASDGTFRFRAALMLSAHWAARRAVERALPSPRLAPVPAPLGRCWVVALSLRQSESDGSGSWLVLGPLVTYAALRASFWGQRRSIGLWVQWAAVSSRSAAETLQRLWGIRPELMEIQMRPEQGLLRASSQLEECACHRVGSLRPLPLPFARELTFYSRRGSRLLNSRATLDGEVRWGIPLRAGLELEPSLARATGLRAAVAHAVLAAAGSANAVLHRPGREYDL